MGIVTDRQLTVLGACFVLFTLWRIGQDYERKEAWILGVFAAGYAAMMFWAGFAALFGFFALAGAGFYSGKAIINQAHSDIRPDESEGRRRLYTIVQVAVSFGILWLVGWLVGIDWLADDN